VPVEEALGPGAGFVVAIPVEPSDKAQTLRRRESETMDIGDESEQRNQRLTAAGQSKLVCLLGGAFANAMTFAPDDCACSR
jgi:hypothetical protein